MKVEKDWRVEKQRVTVETNSAYVVVAVISVHYQHLIVDPNLVIGLVDRGCLLIAQSVAGSIAEGTEKAQ